MDIANDTFLVLVLYARLAVGSFLLPSAVGKMKDRSQFTVGVRAYRILPDRIVPLFSWVLPWLELTLALALLLGVYLSLAALGVSILVSCVTIAVVVNLVRGRAIPCHCHGLAGNRTITWGTVARNMPLIGISLWLSSAVPLTTTWAGWLQRWTSDHSLVNTPGALLVLGCMLAFWWVALALIEWTIAVYSATTRLVKGQV